MSQQTQNLLTGGIIAAFGAFILFAVIPISVHVPKHLPSSAIAPDFWPRLTALMLMVFGIAISIEALIRADVQTLKVKTHNSRNYRRLVGGFAVLYGAGALVTWIGLPGAAFLIVIVLGIAFGERRWWLLLSIAVLLPLVLYLFFSQVGGVPIPLGLLDD